MNRAHSSITCLVVIVSALQGLAPGPSLRGQDDWDAAEQEFFDRQPGMVQPPVFEIAEETFDQWLFENGNARQARQRLDALLTLQIMSVERVCTLSDAQKKKLQLAGYGDMKRLEDETEEVRKVFIGLRHDQNRINEVWQAIQPLQAKYRSQLFHGSSLFRKVLGRTLDAQQSAQFQQEESERRRFHYEAKIGFAVATLEKGVPLRHDQRQQLVELILKETEPPQSYGQYAYYLVLYRAASIPEEKLKPVFDDAQWRALTQLFARARRMEAQFRRNGHLP